MGAQRGGRPAERRPQIDQPLDAAGRLLQLGQPEAEAALEQDDGDTQTDDRAQKIAEFLAGIDPAEAGADDQPGTGQQHDGRQAQAPCHPLCCHAQRDDTDDDEDDLIFRHRGCSTGTSGVR